MSKYPTLLQQFRSFYFQNNPKDLEQAIEYFSVFGGTGWNVDMDKPLIELVETKLLKNYAYIHGDITKLTQSNKVSHALLSAIAMGDRRMFSSFKRARLSREEGDAAVDTLYENGLIALEYSLELPLNEEDHNSDKLNFIQPFMRFWFSFISPFYKTIKEGNYKEVRERLANREQGFCDLIFQKLSQELLKTSFQEDPILEIGSYWDKNVEIDVLAKTSSGKLIAGSCKYGDAKVKKTELTKLKEKCALAGLEPDIFVIFSKNGFTNELKSLKGETVKLFTLKSFKILVEDISEKDFIECEGKRY
ncbi:MAG: ATPase [Campylobacteraceae bacterium]|nr:ATPase [Campylobacteraceae bacterium]